ncbi:MAG: hypothetical protein ABF535_08285 [Acetobacter sp.]
MTVPFVTAGRPSPDPIVGKAGLPRQSVVDGARPGPVGLREPEQ